MALQSPGEFNVQGLTYKHFIWERILVHLPQAFASLMSGYSTKLALFFCHFASKSMESCKYDGQIECCTNNSKMAEYG